MSKVKKHIRWGLTLLLAAVFALNCGRSGGQTQFAKNMEADANKPAPTYEEWVSLVGQDKADLLYSQVGQDSLNVLTYGVGISNLAYLINNVTSGPKLTAMIGNDFTAGLAGQIGPGGMTGLGAVVTLRLLKEVDNQMQTVRSNKVNDACSGLSPYNGGTPCGDHDTIINLTNILNTLSLTEINQKLVAMFGPAGFALQRSMGGANDAVYVGRMAKVVAHVNTVDATCTAKLCPLLTGLTAAEVTGKLAPLMSYSPGSGVVWADKLVETIESTATIGNLITVIQGVTTPNVTAKMAPIIDTIQDCTKMGYTINNITPALITTVLVPIINNVSVPSRLGTLINSIEDAPTWTAIGSANWSGGQQTWGSPVKATTWGTAGSGALINFTQSGGVISAVNITNPGSNYHPDVTIATPAAWTGCASTPVIHLTVAAGQITGATIANNGGSGCTIVSGAITLTDPTTTTGMARLVQMLNNITPANYYQMLNLIDTVSSGVNPMYKLVLMIQDVQNVTDVVQMLNQMSPAATTPATCTGVINFAGGVGTAATASGFLIGASPNKLGYVAVTSPGLYSVVPTASDAGCPGEPMTVVTAGNSPNITITGIYLNNLPVNSMAEMVDNITLANTPRLVQVINGQRMFDNTGLQSPAATAGTYLSKMVTLITGLSQPQEGPIKVTQMINGVTNTDKIIDLIYGVTATTNLSQIINGIFSASLGLGCSDSSTSTYLTAGNCDLGATTVAGNGFVWGMRNQSVNTMVYVLENVTNTQNLIGLINGTTPSQVSGLINHVASSGNGVTTFNSMNSTQIEDPNSATCGTCNAATLANTSTYSGAGMRLAKVIDFSATASYPYDLAFLVNKTSVLKVAKLIIQMPIGQTATGSKGPLNTGAGKIADLMTQINSTPASIAGVASTGNCFYTGAWPPPGVTGQVISATITAAGAGYTSAPTVSFACDATVKAVSTINATGNVNGIYITDPGTAGGCAANAAATIAGGATATANIGHCASSRGLAQLAATGTGPLVNIGKGKLVNVVNYISAASDTVAMTQMRDLVDGVTEAAKLGDLINRVQRSSNVLALLNAVTDTNNNTSTSQMVSLINAIPRAQMHKLTALIAQLNNAIETATDVLPQMDQDLVAQLMASYAAVSNTSAVTFTASANVAWAGHTLTVGREVVFTNSGGALPSPLVSGLLYYVTSVVPGTSFTVSTTPGGANAVMVGAGTGTHTAMADQPTSVSGVGPTMLASLIGQLKSTGGSGYSSAPTFTAGSFNIAGGTGGAASASIVSGQVSRVNITAAGDCTVLPTVSISAPGCVGVNAPTIAADWRPTVGKGAAPSYINTDTNQTLVALYLTSGGVGCTGAPTVTFSGGTCVARSAAVAAAPPFLPASPPTATAEWNGVVAVDVTAPGSGYTVNGTPTFTGGAPTTAATATAIVAGGLNAAAITNLGSGMGTNYITNNVCPITGAGGSGATCTVTAPAGAVTGCSAVTAGSDYMSGQVVTIGGNARAYAIVTAAGAVNTGANIIAYNSGCGYTIAPTVSVSGCTVNPTATAALNGTGGVGTITVTVAGSGCPRNPRVTITGAHADGANAIIGSVIGNNGVGSGYLAAVSLSTPGDNLANLMTNLEKAPLTAAVNYNSTAPSISAREGMVRLLHHGVYYTTGPVPSLFPGVGPGYLANTLMATLSSGNSTMTVIGMMASDTASFGDITVLVGCGDGVPYAISSAVATATANDWETFCRANGVW